MLRGVGALVAVLAALAVVAPAQASPNARFGIQDDAWLMYGPGTLSQRVTLLDSLGVRLVRFTLRWDEIAPRRPAEPRNPRDRAYRWGQFEAVLQELRAHGIVPLVTLWGAPRWANGGGAPRALPQAGFGDFAYAAAKRFPWVRLWTAWNEPNGGMFASPVSPRAYVRQVLNPAYAALHRANGANRVAGGVTSPRRTPSGMSPADFMVGMRLAGARLDAYAQNPYPVASGETPSRSTCARCTYFTLAKLPEIRAAVDGLFGRSTELWLTEYGYQTNPPDRLLGVSYGRQAAYVGQAALRVWEARRTTMLIQFLVRDEPRLGGWQSGLFTTSGTAKLSYSAFALPLVQRARRGARVLLWGQVRPGSGRRLYVLQRHVGATWRSLGSARTDPTGTFVRTLTLPAGSLVRLWSGEVGYASPALRIS